MAKKVKVIHKAGKKPIKFHEGGLHETTHTPMGQKIPASKVEAAKHGAFGKKGVMQANLMANVLTGSKK